jgi:hypothetical protein
VRLVEQWEELQAALPQGWQRASVTLELDDPAEADRAAVVLGPAAPWRSGASFRLDVHRSAGPVSADPGLVSRILARLDSEGIGGRVEPAAFGGVGDAEEAAAVKRSLGHEWGDLVAALPADWSHALVRLRLDSSDFVDRAALLMAPCNPQLEGHSTLRFRAARSRGYGVAAQMARRSFERLDGEGITGTVEIFHVVSDAHPVATQGPVFRLGGRSL